MKNPANFENDVNHEKFAVNLKCLYASKTDLPFELIYDRGFNQQLDIFEYPVTIEDEKNLPILGRLNKGMEVLNSIANYGGFANIFIHTNILGEKLAYEMQVIRAFINKAWFSTPHDFNE